MKTDELKINIQADLWEYFHTHFAPEMRRLIVEKAIYTLKNKDMDDNSIMPFGKHKGEKMANVPDAYLLWLLDEGVEFSNPTIYKYIADNMESLDRVNHEKEDG